MKRTPFFNAHHSPIGAFSSFTLGAKGASGGAGIELAGPAAERVFIGVEDRDRAGRYRALPFFDGLAGTELDFDVEGLSDFQRDSKVFPFAAGEIERSLGASVDEWRSGDMQVRILTPVRPVPDPQRAADEELKAALRPSVQVELTLDNRQGKADRKAFFGFTGGDKTHAMRLVRDGQLVGVSQGFSTGLFSTDDVYAGIAWQPEAILEPRHPENLSFMLGNLGMLVGIVPAGELKTFRFAVCFFREGLATTGIKSRYLYRRYFGSLEEVARHALAHTECDTAYSLNFDRRLAEGLSEDRAFSLAQAIRSYYGSTQCLELEDGRPLWVVNEGEYRMMNTFDLTVDQAFLELALNPWTVRNVLEFYVEQYAYEDQVRYPGDETLHPGGLAFTHDMGVASAFSVPGRSCYEQAGLSGCFSHMSCEELMNWVLCACLYVAEMGDEAWLLSQQSIFERALESLMNRDDPDPARRNGVMGLDSSRCKGGKEITTYDSLDASLGQARNNVYLAVKGWAVYVLLEAGFGRLGLDAASQQAHVQARLCAKTICDSADEDGLLPAVLGEGMTARIIPAIEGLIYPLIAGAPCALAPAGPYGELIEVLRRHLLAVLQPGICLFPDGGWKLSSSSRNSWLSKIYLCQFVAENVFELEPDARADAAHVDWLLREDNAYYAWSDQMLEGCAVGSRYYPRGVTGILWTATGEKDVLKAIRRRLLGTEP